jgi:hypothetical protein
VAPKPEHVLISYYEKLFKQRYGRKPIINRYRERWGMIDAIDSVGYDNVVRCLDYYFKTNPENHNHGINYFFNNFDKILEIIEAKKADAALRAKLMEETRKRVESE